MPTHVLNYEFSKYISFIRINCQFKSNLDVFLIIEEVYLPFFHYHARALGLDNCKEEENEGEKSSAPLSGLIDGKIKT